MPVKDENDDSVKELITRYLSGETSGLEEKWLMEWVASSPENERLFLDLKKVADWSDAHFSDTHKIQSRIDVNQEWNRFIKNIEKQKEVRPVGKLSDFNTTGFWLRIAASFFVLAVTGGLIYSLLKDDEMTIYQTSESTFKIDLPDGTKVTLNRSSELSYDTDFGAQNRIVNLKGEAFFDVVMDPQKPFIIRAKEAELEVIGTSFTVQAYENIKNIEVIVATGKVKLSVPDLKKEIFLTAGQKGTYIRDRKEMTNTLNQDINFQSWNTRKIIFNETDLLTVIETLNRTYHANITSAADIPTACVVTVTFDQQTLEAVLKVLETTLNLTYNRNGNQIEITDAGC
jgi:ferric-dicitrate binding protein FerR (iron transport regulator)